MSFFAVLDAPTRGAAPSFEVSRLHINFWSLAAIGTRRRMFVFDVGVEIKPTGQESVSEFSLALPFDTLAPRSLKKKVERREIAELIFDSPVEFLSGRGMNVGEQDPFVPGDVLLREARKDTNYSDSRFTLWDLKLSEPVEPGRTRYVRLRFPVVRTGRTWQWTRTRLRRTGAVFDFRISDIRGSVQVQDGQSLVPRIVNVQSAAVFLMTPLWMHARSINPEPKYIRLLEGRVWSQYLDRAPELSRRSRLVVRYWKPKPRNGMPSNVPQKRGGPSESRKVTLPRRVLPMPFPAGRRLGGDEAAALPMEPCPAITTENPMRAFAEFTIDSRRSHLVPVLVGGVLVLLFASMFTDLSLVSPISIWMNDATQWAQELIADLWNEAVRIGLIALGLAAVSLLVGVTPYRRPFISWVRETFHKFEERLFHLLRDIGPRD